MFKGRFIFVAVLLMSVNAMAAYVIVPVPNGGFEGNTYKQNCWDGEHVNDSGGAAEDVPYWFSDFEALDSGVELGGGNNTEGLNRGFLMGKAWKETYPKPGTWVNQKDPSVWQVLPYKIKAGDRFMLAVDAFDNWTESPPGQLQMTLFYVAAGGVRTTLTTVTVPLTATWTTYTLDAGDTTAAVGRLLGIELYNPLESPSWINVDNVRFIIPEPATMTLLGLGGLSLLRIRKRR